MTHRVILIAALTTALQRSPIARNAQQTQSKQPVPCGDLTSYRDMHCQWQSSFFEGGSIQPTERSTCLSSVIWNRIDELRLNLCEGRGMTGECAASKKYARSERLQQR